MGETKHKIFNEKDVPSDLKDKSYGIGIRHVQMFCMTLTIVSLFTARASMAVAVLAMSESPHHEDIVNSSIISAAKTNVVNSTNIKEVDTNVTFDRIPDDNGVESNNASSKINGITEVINNIDVVVSTIETYDWDKKTQSLILSSFFWGYVSMQIPAGILAKKFGGKPILLTALIANSIICCLVPTLAAWGGWILVCMSRVCMGLTQACLFPASHTLLGQWLPENERTSYVGIVYGGVQLGTILALPLSGVLADTAMGWKMIFYAIAALVALNALIWYWFAASTPREHRMISIQEREYIEAGLNISEKKPVTPWRAILTSKPVWVLLPPYVGFAMSFILFFVDMPTYLEKGLQISLKNSALLSALPYIGMWLGGVMSSFLSELILTKGWLSTTVNRKLFQSIAHFGVAGGLIVLSFLGPEHKTMAVATLIAIMTCCGFVSAGVVVNQLDLSPNYAGVILSIINFITNFGSVLMPIATSFILQNDSSNVGRWKWVFLMMAGLSIVTDVIYVIFGTSKKQDWDDPNFLNKQNADPEETSPVLKQEDEKKDDKEKNGSE